MEFIEPAVLVANPPLYLCEHLFPGWGPWRISNPASPGFGEGTPVGHSDGSRRNHAKRDQAPTAARHEGGMHAIKETYRWGGPWSGRQAVGTLVGEIVSQGGMQDSASSKGASPHPVSAGRR